MNSTFKISPGENNFPRLEFLREPSDAQTMANSAFALDTDEIASELRLTVNYLTNFALTVYRGQALRDRGLSVNFL